jgi:phthiocerol/phenolphthiocerol synthesis type-I polyketide synthase D
VPADPKQRRAQEILRWLGEWGGKRVGRPAFAVDPRKKMSEYGLDSIGAVEFAGDLADFLNRPLPPTIAYEFQNIQQLLDFLLQDEE